jgi:hypothetical protein
VEGSLQTPGFGGKYSAEATPLVRDAIMYMVTSNDDVFALNAKPARYYANAGRGSIRKHRSYSVAGSTAG